MCSNLWDIFLQRAERREGGEKKKEENEDTLGGERGEEVEAQREKEMWEMGTNREREDKKYGQKELENV